MHGKPNPNRPVGRDLEHLLPVMDGGSFPIFCPNTVINTQKLVVHSTRVCVMMLDTDTQIRIQHSENDTDLSAPFMLKANVPFGVAWTAYAIVLASPRNIAVMQHD